MGQPEIFLHLKRRRLSGDNTFHSATDIRKAMIGEGCGKVSLQCAKLENAGFLEARYTGKFRDWKRLWRVRKKYLKGEG